MRHLTPLFVLLALAASAESVSAQYYAVDRGAVTPPYGPVFRSRAYVYGPAPCGPYLPCAPPVVPCTPKYREEVVEETKMVPKTVIEKRTVTRQATRVEQREKKRTVMESVPQTVDQQYVETVMVNQTVMQPVTQTVQQAYYQDVVRPVQVVVNGVQNRVGTRQVVQNVPVRVQRAVTKQCQCTESTSGGGVSVQSSQPVTQMVEAVENRQVVMNQQYTYQVPVRQVMTQYQTQRVVSYRPVQQTVNVPVTRQVPQQVVRTRQVVQYQQVPREIVETESVVVPHTVQEEIEVPVTKYVEEKTQRVVRVPIQEANEFGTRIYRSSPNCR